MAPALRHNGLEDVQGEHEILIREGMARVLWAAAYGAWAEEDMDERDPDAQDELAAGRTWERLGVAPPTPRAAWSATDQLAEAIAKSEDVSGKSPLAELFALVMQIDTGAVYEWARPETPERGDLVLFLDSARGINIPRDFIRTVVSTALRGVSDEDKEILLAGPDHDAYWETWDDVVQNATIVDPADGVAYTIDLTDNGDVVLVPDGMEQDENGGPWEWTTDNLHPAQQFGRSLAHMCLRDGDSWFDDHKQSNGTIEWKPSLPKITVKYDPTLTKGRTEVFEWAIDEAPEQRESTVHRIRITFEERTPGPSDDDEPEIENGWEDEEGFVIDEDEDESIVDATVKFLRREGIAEPSSSPFSVGTWYIGDVQQGRRYFEQGIERRHDYHLDGYTPEQEREVYDALFTPSGRWRRP